MYDIYDAAKSLWPNSVISLTGNFLIVDGKQADITAINGLVANEDVSIVDVLRDVFDYCFIRPLPEIQHLILPRIFLEEPATNSLRRPFVSGCWVGYYINAATIRSFIPSAWGFNLWDVEEIALNNLRATDQAPPLSNHYLCHPSFLLILEEIIPLRNVDCWLIDDEKVIVGNGLTPKEWARKFFLTHDGVRGVEDK